MAGERNFDFREVPNKYKLFTDRVSVLNRKVLVEKTETLNNFLDSDDYIFRFLQNDITHIGAGVVNRINFREELEKSRVYIEKDVRLLERKRTTKEYRRKFIRGFFDRRMNVKSTDSDITCDITSFENIDFNRPCTKEEKIELGKRFDYYVYKESIDEINCEIKEKDTDGIDYARVDYLYNRDKIADSLTEYFTKNQTIRLPDDYEEQVQEKLNNLFLKSLRRRVLVEKNGFPTHQELVKYEKFLPTVRESENRRLLTQGFRNRKDYIQDREEMIGNIYRQFMNINHR